MLAQKHRLPVGKANLKQLSTMQQVTLNSRCKIRDWSV